ncbi:MAG: hypothetical protein AB9880_01885 [Christensenellales bacterium]
MNRKSLLMIALSVALACAHLHSAACTIFNAQSNGMLLVGNNEEHEDPNGEVRFEPASEGKYGKITFAFGPFTQGGMNDQGLVFDVWAPSAFRLPPWQVGQLLPDGKAPERQPTMDEMWQICTLYDVTSKQMLEACATLEEAVAFYGQHYEASLGYAHILVTDRSGASADITWDWARNALGVTRKSDTFQVIGIGSDYIFPRLSTAGYNPSVESFRDLLRYTSIDATAYSNIYDLKQGLVYVYNQRDYEHPILFDLKAELGKGLRLYLLKNLFAGQGP